MKGRGPGSFPDSQACKMESNSTSRLTGAMDGVGEEGIGEAWKGLRSLEITQGNVGKALGTLNCALEGSEEWKKCVCECE